MSALALPVLPAFPAIPAEFDDVARAVERLAAGRPIVVTDDADRENEGDLIAAGSLLTSETLGFLVRHTSGYICAPMTRRRARRLGLDLMVPDNQDPRGTAYTVSCDAATGVTTGISAADRARTIRLLASPDTTATSLRRPGHVLPLIAREGGVLERPGHTEAAVDLCRLAGLAPVAAIGEIVDDAGALMRADSLRAFCAEHGLALESRGSLLIHPPLAYPDLIASALHARGVITDSGGLQKEAFLLRVPCTTVRPQTEWVETVELGWNRLVEPGEALVEAASRPRPTEPREANAHPYGDGHAAERVVAELTAHLPG